MQLNQGKILKFSQKVNDFLEYMWYNRTNIMGMCVKFLKIGLNP